MFVEGANLLVHSLVPTRLKCAYAQAACLLPRTAAWVSTKHNEAIKVYYYQGNSLTMGKVYAAIDDRLARFIRSQHLFFVGTAPAGTEGHINLSPKGLDSLRILDPLTVAYLDLTGSGVETVAHLRENGRITLLFCAFEGAPKIVRLYGHGTVLEPTSLDFEALRPLFPAYSAVRSIIRISLHRIMDSCGFGVPLMRYEHDRDQLPAWAAKKGERQILTYQREHNVSIDGLPGLLCHDIERSSTLRAGVD